MNETAEFKERLNNEFEKEIVGFLNKACGGTLYIDAEEGSALNSGVLDQIGGWELTFPSLFLPRYRTNLIRG